MRRGGCARPGDPAQGQTRSADAAPPPALRQSGRVARDARLPQARWSSRTGPNPLSVVSTVPAAIRAFATDSGTAAWRWSGSTTRGWPCMRVRLRSAGRWSANR